MSVLAKLVPVRRSISYQDYFQRGLDWPSGNTSAGETVTVEKAFGIAVAWSCAMLLADVISSLPVDVFRKTSGVRQLIENTPRFVANPSATFTSSEWRYQAVISLAFWGNGYGGVIARTKPDGWPDLVEILNPDLVKVDRKSDLDLPDYQYNHKAVAREDIIHMRRFVRPGSAVGLAPLMVHKETFGLGLAARKFAAEWFGDSAHPSALLINAGQINEEIAKEAKKRWVESSRGRGIRTLGNGWQYQAVQATPADSELGATFDRIGIEVCQAFRVPPEMVGLATKGSSVTYANREQRSIDFLTYSLLPWLTIFENMWTANLPRPQFAKFNTGALLRSDLITRYKAHDISIRGGFGSVNERRALEDQEPIDGGDVFLWPPYRTTVLQEVDE